MLSKNKYFTVRETYTKAMYPAPALTADKTAAVWAPTADIESCTPEGRGFLLSPSTWNKRFKDRVYQLSLTVYKTDNYPTCKVKGEKTLSHFDFLFCLPSRGIASVDARAACNPVTAMGGTPKKWLYIRSTSMNKVLSWCTWRSLR